MYGDAGAFQVSRSLRFNSADSAYLSRTPASAGNRKTWTWSGWVKRSALGTAQYLFCSDLSNTSATTTWLFFNTDNTLGFGTGGSNRLFTTQVFRDTSAWYHIALAVDTTQSTAANRYIFYINGVQVTAYGTADYVAQNTDTFVNVAEVHTIGRWSWDPFTDYFNGYLANIHFIDGGALTPSSFTKTDATTGQLIPIIYTGSYGTNGFYLEFADNSSNTASTLGKDTSGNGNNWTPNNLSVTAGAGNDSLVDSPTNYGTDTGVGGEVRGNYCTLNPLKQANNTLTNGNLDWSDPSSDGKVLGTIGMSSGKWYWECTMNDGNSIIGIAKDSATLTASPGYDANSWAYIASSGNKITNSSGSAYGNTFTTSDVIGVAFDADAGSLYFYKNGTVQNSGTAAFTGLTSGPYFPAFGNTFGAGSANFGQRAFAYTAPSGYKALCTTNLPASLVTKSNTVMDVALYTGNGSTQSITGLAFSPDFVWIKCRSSANGHALMDVVRGSSQRLFSELTDAEDSTASLTSFDSNGFSVSTVGGVSGRTNQSSQTYAGWCWDAGTSTVSNTQGSITSQVRANATAGFSVVTYTGNGTSGATVGHGLNVAPQLLIVKRRSSAGSTANWAVWHGSLTAGQNLFLNTTDSASAYSPSRFTSTLPTSTVFSIGGGDETNYSGGTFVAYCFAPVVGYSSFGSYTGNGSSDGPFVYTGFRPKWIMYKIYSGDTSHWFIHDTARSPYNESNYHLWANLSNAEPTSIFYPIDILSNGFKIRSSNVNINGSGYGFIYMAFAEAPFNYSRAR